MTAYGLAAILRKAASAKAHMSFNPAFTPSWSDVERYKRLRSLGKELNHRMVQTIPRETLPAVGEVIGILHQGVLVFATEDMSGVLMDCCLYDWPLEGESRVQRYVETHTLAPGSEEHSTPASLSACRVSDLGSPSAWRGAGVHFADAFSGDQFFVMDIGLSQSPFDPEMALASRIIPLGAYWMTGGVGLPMTEEGTRDRLSPTRSGRVAGERNRNRPTPNGAGYGSRMSGDWGGRACGVRGSEKPCSGNDTAGHAPRRSVPAPAERSLPLRQRQEVQEVLWGHYRVATGCVTDQILSR